MAIDLIDQRRIEKTSTDPGALPTIAPSEDHTDGSWNETDIYPGELFINLPDKKAYSSNGSEIFELAGAARSLSDTLAVDNIADDDIVFQSGFGAIFNTGLFSGSLLSELLTADRSWDLPDKDGRLLVDSEIDGTHYEVVFYGATGLTSNPNFKFEISGGLWYLTMLSDLKFNQDVTSVYLGGSTDHAGHIYSNSNTNKGGSILLAGHENATVPNGVSFMYDGTSGEYLTFTKEVAGDPIGDLYVPLNWHTTTAKEIIFTGAEDAEVYGDGINLLLQVDDGKAIKIFDSIGGEDPVLLLENGNVVLGRGDQADSDTDGFLYLPNVNATPVGDPTMYGNRVPLIMDASADKAWVFMGGAWKYIEFVTP